MGRSSPRWASRGSANRDLHICRSSICCAIILGVANADDERTRREKVAGKITILDRSLGDTLPYLFNLPGIVEGDDTLARMDGQIRKRRTLEARKAVNCSIFFKELKSVTTRGCEPIDQNPRLV
jgi:hypothetical protein